ncbi:flagellar filament capping protein FliD [Cryptosporangium minutisporangium]|uniref:Flagellar hook-associated protein 2 n=1 Tax=Cryptosporangium minutisporangium TaxID=113569 RepID=A0ABP6TC10_9ACTN
MVTSIGGLSSGIDTTSLINSLMQVEAQPQNSLRGKVSDVTTANTAYQTVNTKMKSLLTAAQDLLKADTWKAAKATSSSTDVTVTASPGALSGDMTFNVTTLAKAHRMTSAFADANTAVTPSGSFDITIGDQVTSIVLDPDKNTPQGAADAINKANLTSNLGVRASVVTTADGPVLQIASTKTGAANAFQVTGMYDPPTVMTEGSDAELVVGDPNAGGFKVTSSSNTFTGVMPGVTITATKAPAEATVGVVADTDTMAAKMQALVDAANGALAQINLSSASTPGTSSGAKSSSGPLAGDYTVRQLAGKILSAVSTGADKAVAGLESFGSFKKLGVELTRDGKLTFNKDTFVSAYNTNPGQIKEAVTTGLAKTMETVGKAATDSIDGALTTKIKSNATMISRLNKEILDWDTTLANRRTALQRQFTGMESALSKISSQSSWLGSQMSGGGS